MINIIVCGSRNFSDYSVFSTAMDDFLAQFNLSEICLFSGGARGADSFAITYAQERNLQCKIFPALWSRFGKSAGPRRNHWMVTDAHACFAFHDGISIGTAHMLRISRAKGIATEVYYFANQLSVF